jgi:hypothetical protein
MRTMLMSTAAIGLVATLLTVPAQADRVCRKVCHDGFCVYVQRTSPLYARG